MRDLPKLFKPNSNGYASKDYTNEKAYEFHYIYHGFISENYYGPQVKVINNIFYKEYQCNVGDEPVNFVLEYILNNVAYGWIPLDLNDNTNRRYREAMELFSCDKLENGNIYTLIGPEVGDNHYKLSYDTKHRFYIQDVPMTIKLVKRDWEHLYRMMFLLKSRINTEIRCESIIFCYENDRFTLNFSDFNYYNPVSELEYDVFNPPMTES